MNCWITTHWPSPRGREVARHVYFKARRRRLPRPGDLVLIYESETVHVNGKAVDHAILRHRGEREQVGLPRGRGEIVAAVTVEGGPRPITEEDLTYDYGDWKEWSLIPCGRPRAVRELPRREMMELLGKEPATPVRFLGLWRVPYQRVPGLLARLGL